MAGLSSALLLVAAVLIFVRSVSFEQFPSVLNVKINLKNPPIKVGGWSTLVTDIAAQYFHIEDNSAADVDDAWFISIGVPSAVDLYSTTSHFYAL